MDILTFLMALLALLVAALALGWQIATWTLDGRRTKVSLRYGHLAGGGIVSGRVDKHGKPLDLSNASVPGGLGPAVIGIEVRNSSRTARVRVDSIAACIDNGAMFDPSGSGYGDPLPLWLDAGETRSWYLDATIAKQLVEVSRVVDKKIDSVRMIAFFSHGENAITPERLKIF